MLHCLFALCHPNVEPVLAYVSTHGKDMDVDEHALRHDLERWYAQAIGSDTLKLIVNPSTTSSQRRYKCAQRFLKEWELHKWLEKTNLVKGIAPCSSMLCQNGGPPGIEPTAIPFGPGCQYSHRSKLQWCRRWRRRWNVHLGKIAPGERISPAVAQTKDA